MNSLWALLTLLLWGHKTKGNKIGSVCSTFLYKKMHTFHVGSSKRNAIADEKVNLKET
jgi:hypothetical protein